MKTTDCINGKIIERDVTLEEMEERNKPKEPQLPTAEERLNALEMAMLEMAGVDND